MIERGLHVDHPTIYCCVHHYAPELDKPGPPHLKSTNHSWRVDDDLYQSEKGVDVSLSCRGPSGEHSGIYPQPTRIAQAAKHFFSRALNAPQFGLISLTLTKQALFPSSIFSIAHRAHTTQASFGSNCLASTTTILKKSFEAPSR